VFTKVLSKQSLDRFLFKQDVLSKLCQVLTKLRQVFVYTECKQNLDENLCWLKSTFGKQNFSKYSFLFTQGVNKTTSEGRKKA
jgi:hypothetical protein